jgi:hypothetical protein
VVVHGRFTAPIIQPARRGGAEHEIVSGVRAARDFYRRAPAGRSYVAPCRKRHRPALYSGVEAAQTDQRGACDMPDITIVFWRDIPAQVIVGKGRRGAKLQLSERFEQAIDRAAMKSGAAGTDAYLAEWRKRPSGSAEGEAEDLARAEAARLEAEYDADRIKTLIGNDGWA